MTTLFNRAIWTEDFTSTKSTASWLCGKCFSAGLEAIDVRTTVNSQFTAIFCCTNINCKHRYTSCGKITYWLNGYPINKEYVGKKTTRYYPKFFYPEIQLFKIPDECSIEVKREISSAFQHFWSDHYATLNALRRSLEYLMDQLEIPVMEILHQRLLKFSKIRPDLSESLEAVKIMGNAGSHKEVVHREDVLDTFQIYQHILLVLFPGNYPDEIASKVSKIIGERRKRK